MDYHSYKWPWNATFLILLSILLTLNAQPTYKLADRIFVLSLNVTGDVFSIASVPEVQSETYSFRGESRDGLTLNSETGVVGVTSSDWHKDEVTVTLQFVVTSPQGSNDLDVHIHRVDRGPYSPVFKNSPYPMVCGVPQWIRPDTTIYTLTAIDAIDYGATVKYQLESGGEGRFTVDANTGELKVLQRLPFDSSAIFTLAVSAQVVGMVVSETTPTQVVTVRGGDLPPQFSQPEYVINMDEFDSNNIPTENNPIANISVLSFYDLPIQLTLAVDALADSTVPVNKFRIDNKVKTGPLTTAALLPAPTVTAISALTDPRQYRLTLTAKEDVSDFTSSVQVIINVVDINDHAPFFLSDVYTRYDVSENVAIDTSMVTVKAVDHDEGDNGLLEWAVDNDHFEVVGVDNNTAEIKTKQNLDFDVLPMGWYEFKVMATDHGTPNKTGSATVRIWVKNTNNKSPVFEPANQVAYVRLRLPNNSLVHVVQAYDPDGPTFPDFSFSFQGSPTYDKFKIDATTGHITLTEDFPEDKMEKIYLPVTLDDRENPANTQNVTIDIMGINRPPQIPNCTLIQPRVMEEQPLGTDIVTITATDPDSGSNGELVFRLALPPNQQKTFDIVQTSATTATLKTAMKFDREEPKDTPTYYRIGDDLKYPVTVEVLDKGTDPLSTTCFFLVTIDDINDWCPVFDNDEVFEQEPAFIKEDPTTDTERLFRAFAFDRDRGDNAKVEYKLTNLNCDGCLRIDTNLGYIYADKTLPPIDEITDIRATVEARDKDNPPMCECPAYLNITLRRTNTDLPPTWQPVQCINKITDIDDCVMTIWEDAGQNDVLDPVFSVEEDWEINFLVPPGSFPESNNPTQFRADVQSNNAMRIRKLQKQSRPLKYIKLRAYRDDGVKPRSDKRLQIAFQDVNLNTPEYTGRNTINIYPAYISTESSAGYLVANVFAIDEDATERYNRVNYAFSSDCGAACEDFTIDENTGEVRTKKKFETPGTIQLSIFARDGENETIICEDDRTRDCYRKTDNQRLVVTVAGPISDRPYFPQPGYSVDVEEGFYPGKKITKIAAEFTGPVTKRREIQHSLISGNDNGVFAVEASSGQIYQVGELEYETKQEYTITYGVFYGELSNTTVLTIKIKKKPCLKAHQFTATGGLPIFTQTLTEEEPTPTLVATLPEVTGFGFSLTGALNESFKIEGKEVHITKPLDRDYPKGYSEWQVNVEAVCNTETTVPENATRTYAMVQVTLNDINDNSPVFDPSTVYASILENQNAGTNVGQVVAVDYDVGENAEVTYELLSSEDGNQFGIDETTGLLTSKFPFDREVQDSYRTIVKATDKGPKDKGSVSVLQYTWITIEDENDHPPVFPGSKKYEATVPENQPLAASVVSVLAEDEDIGDNARRDYSVTNEHFTMDSVYSSGAGVVKIKKMIDYETMGSIKSINFKVKVKGPKDSDTDEADVTVHVTDVNDNAPVMCPVTSSVVEVMGVKCPDAGSISCLQEVNVTVEEGKAAGLLVAEFTGCDEDTGQNADFIYSIDYRNTDQDKNFQVTQTGSNARVTIRKSLDRENIEKHVVHLLAIDKGVPPLTGTTTLTVTVGDINDNAPEFTDPEVLRVVPETPTVGAVVGEWGVFDRDGPSNGAPFTVNLDCAAESNKAFCDMFELTYDPGTEKVKVTTKVNKYERTATLKRYIASITLKDSGTPPSEAKRELSMEIEDKNNHQHSAATKFVTVYSYKGLFTDVNLGHFYAADIDDWDRTEKTYKLVGTPKGFKVRTVANWELVMSRGVDPTLHTLEVDIGDPKFATVRSQVDVNLRFLDDEGLHSSGSVRLQGVGLTPEEFIERPGGQASKLDVFKGEVARVVGGSDVQVFHIHQVDGQTGVVDVYYTVSLSTLPVTYLRPSRLDGNVWINKAQIEKALDPAGNIQVLMAPVNDCPQTSCWDGTCNNKLVIVSEPITVDANVTSHVGINVMRQATCSCDTRTFPSQPEVCTETTCLNGGTCHQTWGNANCTCPAGFEGPRCQKLKRSFGGQGWAWFNPLYLCKNDVIRFRFATSAKGKQQLLAYSGPMLAGDSGVHLIIQLQADGYPQISVDMGSGAASAKITGKDKNGGTSQLGLDDGRWHTLEVYKAGHEFRLIVDHCESSIITEDWNATEEDRSACQASLTAPGDDLHVAFSSPLQLGGRRPSMVPLPAGFGDVGLTGCIKDFFHNGEIYDLYVGNLGQANGSTEDCPAESSGATYSLNYKTTHTAAVLATSLTQKCEGDLVGGDTVCTCVSMKQGQNCTEGTVTRDYLTDKGYLEWKMNAGKSDNRNEFLQLSFRTRNPDGLLFFGESETTLERCFLQVISSHLTFTFDLGSGDKVISLNQLNVSDGLWHTAYVGRHGNQVILTVDGGEGLYYTESEATDNFRLLLLKGVVDGGAAVTYRKFHTVPVVTNSVQNSYLTDVRFSATRPGDAPLAMTMAENPASAGALTSDNTNDVRIGAAPNPPCDIACSPTQTCLDYWKLIFCGCLDNQTAGADGTCTNLNDCTVLDCRPTGICVPQEDLSGKCYYKPPEVFSAKAGIAGSALGIIIGALFLLLLLLLLATLVKRKKPVVMLTDNELENHTRDNMVSYEVEGAGDELPSKTDLKTLLIPMNVIPPVNPQPATYTEEEMNQQNAGPGYYMAQPERYSDDVSNLILKNKMAADDDEDYPADLITTFEHEGSASLATSLSSLQSSSTGDLDYNNIANYGPRFQRLADLYGDDDEESDEGEEDMGIAYPANVLKMNPDVNPVFASRGSMYIPEGVNIEREDEYPSQPTSMEPSSYSDPDRHGSISPQRSPTAVSPTLHQAYGSQQQPSLGYSEPSNGHPQPFNGHQEPLNGYQEPFNGHPNESNGYSHGHPMNGHGVPEVPSYNGPSEYDGQGIDGEPQQQHPYQQQEQQVPNPSEYSRQMSSGFGSPNSPDDPLVLHHPNQRSPAFDDVRMDEPKFLPYHRSTTYSPTSSSSPPQSGDYNRSAAPPGTTSPRVRFEGVGNEGNLHTDPNHLQPPTRVGIRNVAFEGEGRDQLDSIEDSVFDGGLGYRNDMPQGVPALALMHDSSSDSSSTIVKRELGQVNKGYKDEYTPTGAERWPTQANLNGGQYTTSLNGESNV